MTMRKQLALTLAVGVAGSAGCSLSVDSVDRTQPNALSKTMFSGLWYHRATVVEADPDGAQYSSLFGLSTVFEGITSTTEKIRWEMTEDLLIAYRSFEFVPYAEGLTDEGRDFFGSPVAAFPIESHFDIQREYNRTTGVETNVISENTTDRPWNERQYIRVDWSENLVRQNTAFTIGFPNYPSGTLSGQAAVKYYVQGDEETNPDRPFITQDYFDITNVYSLEPSEYICLMMQLVSGAGRCGAANAKVRLSFRKVDPDDDYESLYYPDVLELKDESGAAVVLNFSGRPCDGATDPSQCTVQTWPYDGAYGNFRTLRVAFDRERFLTRTGRIYMAGRYDLWQDSFEPNGERIPYSQRVPQPVVYYSNTTFPDEFLPGARAIAESWAKPLDETVAMLKYHEAALQSGQGVTVAELAGSVETVRSEVGGGMFQFEQNACNPAGITAYAQANGLSDVVDRVVGQTGRVTRGNLAQVCAAVQFAELEMGKTLDPKVAARDGVEMAFTWQRFGDIRYNFMNYIEEAVQGPLGVAQFAQDPETGEFIGGNIANYFGDAGDAAAQREVDILQWLNGDLNDEELFRGDITRATTVSRRTVQQNQIRSRVRRMLMDHEGQLLERHGNQLFDELAAGTEDDRFSRAWKGTDIERDFLIDDEMLLGFAGPTRFQPFGNAAAGFDPTSGLVQLTPGNVSNDAREAASVANWGTSPQNNEFMRAAYELGQNAFDMAEFFDPNSSGLAEFVKGWDRDRIYNFMREEIFTAIEAHEVGHAVGLRHNFQSSMDPLNYKPEFWWTCEGGGTDCDASTAIQHWSSPPTEQNKTRGNEFKYASVMDYGFSLPLSGFHGIGTYDEAAVRFQYGQIQEVWDNRQVSVPDPRKYQGFAQRCGHDDDFWGLPSLTQWMGPEQLPRILSQGAVDQSACAGNYDGTTACDSPMDTLYREFVNRVETAAGGEATLCAVQFSDVNWLLGEIKKLEPRARQLNTARKYVSTNFLINQQRNVIANPPEYDNPATTVDETADGLDSDGDGLADDKGYDWATYQYPVEHGYCSDIYANFSNPFCQRFDAGWDFEEAVQYHINRFDRDYVFNHFRRDRLGTWGDPRTYVSRLQAVRLFHMTNVFRYSLFTRQSAFEADLYEDWAEAAYRGINFMERVLQAPEPGRYCLDTDANIYRKYSGSGACESSFDIPLGFGGGYQLQSSWSNEYFYEPNVIGYYYDKLAVIQQMTTSSGQFVRDFSDVFDRRSFSLGYLRVYLDPMLQRFSSLITGDHTGYRSHVVIDPDTQERYVRYMPLFDEARDDDSSVRDWLTQFPEIEPAWSWTLRYMALAYSLGNWSSVNDFAPEMYRFTKISIRGTPEDLDYPDDIEVLSFTDPSTLITYRSPVIPPLVEAGLLQEFPAYYGDRWHQNQDPPMFRNWSVGASILEEANRFVDTEYTPAQAGCEAGTGVGPVAEGNRWATTEDACQAYQVAEAGLNERVGFIDQVRKFSRRVERPITP